MFQFAGRNPFFEEEDRVIFCSYLKNKYMGCVGDQCNFSRDRMEVAKLLKQILPPVTSKELEVEVELTMAKFKGGGEVDEKEFIDACLENSYWKSAGPLVVKELVLLDAINGHYFDGTKLLSDDEYDELKESLTWEGSMVATLKGKEAKFISAVANHRRGIPVMSDDEYELLKKVAYVQILVLFLLIFLLH